MLDFVNIADFMHRKKMQFPWNQRRHEAYTYQCHVGPSTIGDLAEHVTNHDQRCMASEFQLANLKEMVKADDKKKKTVLEVMARRLDCPWPMVYKALDVLKHIAEPGDLLTNGIHDKLKKHSGDTSYYASHIKPLAKSLLDKADAEQRKREEKAAEEQQAAILNAWCTYGGGPGLGWNMPGYWPQPAPAHPAYPQVAYRGAAAYASPYYCAPQVAPASPAPAPWRPTVFFPERWY